MRWPIRRASVVWRWSGRTLTTFEDIDAGRAFENAIVGEFSDRRIDKCSDPYQCHRETCGGGALDNDDWMAIGYDTPLLVNLQPAGEYICEEYYRAGGVPAVLAEPIAKNKLKPAITANGKTLIENCEGAFSPDRRVIKEYDAPMKEKAGFRNMSETCSILPS